MADNNPANIPPYQQGGDADVPPHQQHAAAATRESSGYSNDGDTPPAQGLGVGPTKNDIDVDHPGEGAKNKTAMIVIAALVALFIVLAIIGRFGGLF